jgi:hypothetical protein
MYGDRAAVRSLPARTGGAGVALVAIGVVNRATRIGRLVIALGVVWFVLGLTTSTLLLSTGTKIGGGAPVRVATPDAHS